MKLKPHNSSDFTLVVPTTSTTLDQEGSEEEKAPLLGDKRDPESDGVVREEGATAEIKVEDEIETTDGAEGSDDVDSKTGGPAIEDKIEDNLRKVEEIQDIMRNNIETLWNQLVGSLQNLLGRTEELVDVASDFAKVSRRARVRMWLRSNRRTICICTTVVLVVIAGVIATVVVLISKGIIKIKT
ncbi:hypothetical protein Bbelb_171620 [Branchiostoma belcheri]|nr:hypothetical protein Bbelb_171620 [Branchiostoma belcheri]